jgi:hypothetical protein
VAEGLLESVVVLPVREIGDGIAAHFLGQILAAFGGNRVFRRGSCLAERGIDGSRGLQPTDRWWNRFASRSDA